MKLDTAARIGFGSRASSVDLGLHSGDLALPEAPSGSMLFPCFVKKFNIKARACYR